MESKISITTSNTNEELRDLFFFGKPLSGLKITYLETKSRRIYHRPFGNVLASNKYGVLQEQDFDGEPFLKGKFEFRQVLLPEKRSVSLYQFYPILIAILNGYHVCTKANKDRLTSLAHNIFHYYAPLMHVKSQTQERMDSFNKIEDIIEKVIASPVPFKGRKKYESILWNPDYNLTSKEKSDLCNKDKGEKLLNKRLKILIDNYSEGMTQDELVEKTNISLSTVKRRWKTIRNYTQEKPIQEAA